MRSLASFLKFKSENEKNFKEFRFVSKPLKETPDKKVGALYSERKVYILFDVGTV